jgi:hypothetical protein
MFRGRGRGRGGRRRRVIWLYIFQIVSVFRSTLRCLLRVQLSQGFSRYSESLFSIKNQKQRVKKLESLLSLVQVTIILAKTLRSL